MDLPYHLSGYKNRLKSLSPQALSILQFVVKNTSYKKIRMRILQEKKLESDTFKILRSAFPTDSYDLIYNSSWSLQQAFMFWSLVQSKCNEDYLYFILGTLYYLKGAYEKAGDLFMEAFKATPNTIFSFELIVGDIDFFYSDKNLRYDFLRLHFQTYILHCENMEELEEDVSTWQERFEGDTKAVQIIQQVANERKF